MENLNTQYDTNMQLVTPKGCVKTFTGKIVDLFNPNPEQICLEDIAHGLAHTCRWNGHTRTFYSVAEHSIRVAKRFMAEDDRYFTSLFHDAEESYFGDIVNPLKVLLPVSIIEAIVNFREAIFKKFNVPPIDGIVDAADKIEMEWDYANLMQSFNHVGMPPKEAKRLWLQQVSLVLAHHQFKNYDGNE